MSSSLDVGSLRVAELRKELRSRGLSAQGDKAELATRLRAALSIDELDLTALDEEHDSAMPLPTSPSSLVSPTSPTAPSIPPIATVTATETPAAPPQPVAKKIVLNRAPITAPTEVSDSTNNSDPATTPVEIERPPEPKQTRLVADSKSRLEMRAKRFGLPLGGDAIKEARKARFGGNAPTASAKRPITSPVTEATTASLQVLKKRAERFGCSVSKIMVDVENQEKLERRKEKFSAVKSWTCSSRILKLYHLDCNVSKQWNLFWPFQHPERTVFPLIIRKLISVSKCILN